jgi:secretion/DNA translocation related TadE-like protein
VTATREGGSATVLTLGAVASLVLVLTGALMVVSTVRDVHRARGAADLAALAASGPAADGGAVDCGVGASVAAANGAVLARCEPGPDGTVLVTAQVARSWPPSWSWLPAAVSARARAGPVVDGAPP